MEGRNYIMPNDIKFMVPHVLGHRIFLSTETSMTKTSESVLQNVLERSERKDTDSASYSLSKQAADEGMLPFRRFKNRSPENRIRKEIYHLEKFAEKLQLGRYEFESLSEWMGRIGLKDCDKIITVYEKVRYSTSEDNGNFNEFKQEVEKKKKELKEIKKKIVQEERAKQKSSFTEKIFEKDRM